MGKLIVIAAAVIILPMLYVSMVQAGYSWRQAAGFDLLISLLFLASVLMIKLNAARKELIRREDNFYD